MQGRYNINLVDALTDGHASYFNKNYLNLMKHKTLCNKVQ
jgi:hypothetical protein